MKRKQNLMWQGWNGNEMYFFYDNTGTPVVVFWYFPKGGSRITGYYLTNQQGGIGLIWILGLSALTQSTQSMAIPQPEAKTQEKEQEKDNEPSKPRRDPVHHIVAKADPCAAKSNSSYRP